MPLNPVTFNLGHKSTDPDPASLGSGSVDGGQSGIRTHGRLPYTRFPSVLLKPLRHLSIFNQAGG